MKSSILKSLVLILFLCWWMPSPVAACSPSQDPSDFTLDDYVTNAPIIFVGTIVAGENPYGDTVIMTAEVEVETYLKGAGLAVVTIEGFGYGADCLSIVELGASYIFFAAPSTDGKLQAVHLSTHDAVAPAIAPNIAAIHLITGQSNTPQALSFNAQLSRVVSSNNNGKMMLGISLSILGLGAVFALVKRRPSRKAKMKREEMG